MKNLRPQKFIPVSLLLVMLMAACQSAPFTDSAPTPTATATNTHTTVPTVTASPSSTPVPTATNVPHTNTPETDREAPINDSAADIQVDFANQIGRAPETFGINGWWTDEEAAMWRERYATLNPQIVRIPLFHAVVEPQNDNADPNSIHWANFKFDTPYPVGDDHQITYRSWFSALQAADLTVMVFIPYLAPWLSHAESAPTSQAPYPPQDLTEYQELIEAVLVYLIAEIGFSPDKIIIEPVNEPDLKCGGDAVVACFWQDWQLSDLAAVLESAAWTAHQVDPKIRVAGPALCCRADLLEQLMKKHNAAQYLDILTFHAYGQGRINLNPALSMADRLRNFDKPVYLDEYGNRSYWSNGVKGALWHAVALGEFWQADLPPIQFSMAEMPWMHAGYNELGLFRSWQENWEIKPAYWVYANFFNHFQDTDLVRMASPAEMPGIAGKVDEQQLAIWITNAAYEKDTEMVIRVAHWPARTAQVQVLNNLTGASPVEILHISAESDQSLTISYPIPMLQSLLFLVSNPESNR